jgi:ADP-ribose pyrophosphatase
MVTPGNFTDETVFSTPWFELVARSVASDPRPFYSLKLSDYVSIVAETPDREIVLVKQYRAAVDKITTELPCGTVDPGETPEVTALRELQEETGYTTDKLELTGVLAPDTGRLGNRMWCYHAKVRKMEPAPPPEPGIESFNCTTNQLMEMIGNRELDHALNVAALFMSFARGLLKLDPITHEADHLK